MSELNQQVRPVTCTEDITDSVVQDFQDALLAALNDIGEDFVSMPHVLARLAEVGLEVRRVNRVT